MESTSSGKPQLPKMGGNSESDIREKDEKSLSVCGEFIDLEDEEKKNTRRHFHQFDKNS